MQLQRIEKNKKNIKCNCILVHMFTVKTHSDRIHFTDHILITILVHRAHHISMPDFDTEVKRERSAHASLQIYIKLHVFSSFSFDQTKMHKNSAVSGSDLLNEF